jgi:hypothetical protein
VLVLQRALGTFDAGEDFNFLALEGPAAFTVGRALGSVHNVTVCTVQGRFVSVLGVDAAVGCCARKSAAR